MKSPSLPWPVCFFFCRGEGFASAVRSGCLFRGSDISAVLLNVTVSRSSLVFPDFELGNEDEKPSVT